MAGAPPMTRAASWPTSHHSLALPARAPSSPARALPSPARRNPAGGPIVRPISKALLTKMIAKDCPDASSSAPTATTDHGRPPSSLLGASGFVSRPRLSASPVPPSRSAYLAFRAAC
jgi:hypothetical protein